MGFVKNYASYRLIRRFARRGRIGSLLFLSLVPIIRKYGVAYLQKRFGQAARNVSSQKAYKRAKKAAA